jgi:integrase
MASRTLQQRPNGRWQVRLNLDGGGTRGLGTYDLKRQAKAVGDRALADYRAGQTPGSTRLTLERYWLDTLLPLFVDGDENLAESTRAAKRSIFRARVLPDPLARLPVHRVSEEDVRRFVVRLRKPKARGGAQLAPGTVNNVLTQVAWAFNQARHRGLVSINPTIGVPRLHDEHEPRFLTDQERGRLLRSFRLDQDSRLAEFICETGLRKGEALALTIDQVDVAPLEVLRQLRKDCTLGPLKNRKRCPSRLVGLTARARELMVEQRAWLREEWMRQGKGAPLGSDWLWPGRRLGPMQRDTWDAAFTKAAETARLSIRTHALRHTYAATAIDAGLDIYVLAQQLGDTLAVTEKTYAHLYPDAHQRAAEVLDRRHHRADSADSSSHLVAAPDRN